MDLAGLDLTEAQSQQRDDFIERLLRSTAGVFDIFTIYIGYQLGFYQTLAEVGPLISVDLAAETGIYERYAREWLEQQIVEGIIQVDDAELDPKIRKLCCLLGTPQRSCRATAWTI